MRGTSVNYRQRGIYQIRINTRTHTYTPILIQACIHKCTYAYKNTHSSTHWQFAKYSL